MVRYHANISRSLRIGIERIKRRLSRHNFLLELWLLLQHTKICAYVLKAHSSLGLMCIIFFLSFGYYYNIPLSKKSLL
jgi:hypothetical protein